MTFSEDTLENIRVSRMLSRICIILDPRELSVTTTIGEVTRMLRHVIDKFDFTPPSRLSIEDGRDWKLTELLFTSNPDNLFEIGRDVVGYSYQRGRKMTEYDWRVFFALTNIKSTVLGDELIDLRVASESVKNKIYRSITETYSESELQKRSSCKHRIYFTESVNAVSC